MPKRRGEDWSSFDDAEFYPAAAIFGSVRSRPLADARAVTQNSGVRLISLLTVLTATPLVACQRNLPVLSDEQVADLEWNSQEKVVKGCDFEEEAVGINKSMRVIVTHSGAGCSDGYWAPIHYDRPPGASCERAGGTTVVQMKHWGSSTYCMPSLFARKRAAYRLAKDACAFKFEQLKTLPIKPREHEDCYQFGRRMFDLTK